MDARVNHRWTVTTFTKPTYCAACGGFVWGLKAQGVSCDGCGHAVHHKCAHTVPTNDCGVGGSLVKSAAGRNKSRRTSSGSPVAAASSPPVSTEAPLLRASAETKTATAPLRASAEGSKPSLLKREPIPAAHQCGGHPFELVTFTKPTYCGVCTQFIWGVVKQGLRCALCGLSVHRKCATAARTCRSEDQLQLGALTLGDWRNESESLEVSADGERSKEMEHLVLDDGLIEELRAHYDPTEIVVAIYHLYESGQDYQSRDAVEAQIKHKWRLQQLQQPTAPPAAAAADDDSDSANACVVCMDAAVDSLVLPCKHMCVCAACGGGLSECPVCRGPIAQLVTGIFVTTT